MNRAAIVGAGPTCMDAPFHKPGWDIWACGPQTVESLPVIHRLFEIHSPPLPELTPGHWYRRFLDSTEAEIWALDPTTHPLARQIPEPAVKARFGTEFLSSCIAWMQALAIIEGRPGFGLWGVHMDFQSEYRDQRPGCMHFNKLALELGMTVFVHPDSPLAKEQPAYPAPREF